MNILYRFITRIERLTFGECVMLFLQGLAGMFLAEWLVDLFYKIKNKE